MAPTTKFPNGVRLTPLATLLDVGLRAHRNIGLGTYLASCRTPGADWVDFDSIAIDLTPFAGDRRLNRVTIESFAHDTFGIPNTRYAEGRTMPRQVSDATVAAYLDALDPNVGIDIDRVRQAALGELATVELETGEATP